ncbi:polycomb protein Sfmbt [Sabethes cyaneus]|uniref:polycomb protein Sfmbt n=1 Tax=Sabethes cyaneus TaxID=53552 RepID=UPI00237DFF30|nr:polycomb protein Sfmbt [Sabethes cyaneus]
MNVFNQVIPSMNPQELSTMVWMGQFASPLDENLTNLYGQPMPAVMDDITQQTPSMDMNPAIGPLIGDYSGHVTAIPTPAAALATISNSELAITNPELFNLQQQQLQLQQQLSLGNYSFLEQSGLASQLTGSGTSGSIVGGVTDADDSVGGARMVDDDDEDDGLNDEEHAMQTYEQYQRMVEASSEYLSVSGQESLLSYKLMNESQLLQPQGNFLDYDVNDDGSSSPPGGQQDDVKITGYTSQLGGAVSGGSGTSGATQSGGEPSGTSVRFPNKKIKPVKRPGLVLKTPIAYKGDSDPSVIPIQRDGMAICEKCGAIGVKHSFYTKQRRFCSMTCARSFDALRLYNSTNNNNNSNSSGTTGTSTSSIVSSKSLTAALEESIPPLAAPSALPPEQLIDDSADEVESVNATQAAAGSDIVDSKHLLQQQQLQLQQQLALQHQVQQLQQQQQQQQQQVQNISYRFKMSQIGDNSNHGVNSDKTINHEIVPQDEIPQLPRGARLPSPCAQDERIISIRRKPSEFINSFDWTPSLADPTFFAAPVTCFRHAPGYDMWPNVVIGMKVEVENTDCDAQQILIGGTPHSFWVATVLRICGYKALLRYEGFDTDSSKDFWVNLCSSEVHPVGWCATRGKPLIPPKSIAKPYKDWKEFLVKRLSNARTLPSTFYNKISESFKSRFRVGLNLEVVDKNRISQVKVASINKIVGKRLYVRYYDSPPDDNGFWCHEDSPLIHPVGWATTVGHNLAAPQEYMDRMNAARDQILEPNEDDATMDLFKTNFHFEEYYLEGKQTGFEEGMKLEAVDPLNLSSICVATVMSVLKFGYIMIRIDSYDPDVSGADWFCYHEKSPCIFPVGFCCSNQITLTPPKGYDLTTFTWDQYLVDTNSKPATEDLFHRDILRQKFKVGMKLESADLMDPRLICVATISRVVGRLLKVHFDGWDDEYDQWLDSESPDIYPIGWCVLVGHKLEGPRILPKIPPTQKISPKMTKKGKRKKKVMKFELGTSELHPVATTRTASIKKEQEQFEQQKQVSNADQNNIPYSIADLQSNLDHMQYTSHSTAISLESRSASGSGTSSSLLSIKHEPPHDPLLGPIFDQSTESIGVDDDDMGGLKTEDEDGESNSATGNPSSVPSEITDIEMEKIIPRLINDNGTSSPDPSIAGSQINPDSWDVKDVAMFLTANDCSVHCEAFMAGGIDGRRLLQLSKDEIITLLNMKVGPSLKIFDLIQQLKCKIDPSKSRLLKSSLGKKYL